jgi:hypothetical protein
MLLAWSHMCNVLNFLSELPQTASVVFHLYAHSLPLFGSVAQGQENMSIILLIYSRNNFLDLKKHLVKYSLCIAVE